MLTPLATSALNIHSIFLPTKKKAVQKAGWELSLNIFMLKVILCFIWGQISNLLRITPMSLHQFNVGASTGTS